MVHVLVAGRVQSSHTARRKIYYLGLNDLELDPKANLVGGNAERWAGLVLTRLLLLSSVFKGEKVPLLSCSEKKSLLPKRQRYTGS